MASPADPNAPGVSSVDFALATDSDGDGLSDAFEICYGLNPLSPDSDGDGLLDPAEDPDGDLLSNLGEQQFGTSPARKDTDHNGVSDWNEDADHDGIANGIEQDARHVPAHLRPSLRNARDDTPVSYGDGCHSSVHDSAVHPCVYGDVHATIEVAILGNSHAAQWLPALIAIGNTDAWRIRSVTKSGCPAVPERYAAGTYAAGRSCTTWRKAAIEWLRGHPPDLIVVSDFRGYSIVDRNGRRLDSADRQDAWKKGLSKLLDALPASSGKFVLGDTPRMRVDPVACLREHRTNISACETSRREANNWAHVAAERSAAASSGAHYRTLTGQVCPYDPCPVVVGHYLIWREESHLTATYARLLAPSLEAILLPVVDAH